MIPRSECVFVCDHQKEKKRKAKKDISVVVTVSTKLKEEIVPFLEPSKCHRSCYEPQ
jgi:hypothetical protein